MIVILKIIPMEVTVKACCRLCRVGRVVEILFGGKILKEYRDIAGVREVSIDRSERLSVRAWIRAWLVDHHLLLNERSSIWFFV